MALKQAVMFPGLAAQVEDKAALIEQVAAIGLDAIGHLHTAGNPGRQDLDDDQELNYRGICRALAAAGYQGYLGHEFTPKGDPITALQQAYEQCRGD